MPMGNELLLLDTHCWLWAQLGQVARLSRRALSALRRAESTGSLRISVISIWELAMLESHGRVALPMNIRSWVHEALTKPGISVIDLSPDIALESSNLPGSLHGDLADRIIVASARAFNATLLTKDQRLIDYSKQRHVRILEA
jgi:PIN domain nuclease of toxin-antitoxin system